MAFKKLNSASSISNGIILETTPVDRNEPKYSCAMKEAYNLAESFVEAGKPIGYTDMSNLVAYRISPEFREFSLNMGFSEQEIRENPVIIEDLAAEALDKNPDAYDSFLDSRDYSDAVIGSLFGGITDTQKTTVTRVSPKSSYKPGKAGKIAAVGGALALALGGTIAYLESQNSDHDQYPDYRDPHPGVHETLYSYARSLGIPEKISLKSNVINVFGSDGKIDSNTAGILKYVASLSDEYLQEKVIDAFAADKVITGGEARQADYLGTLTKEKQAEIINSGNTSNQDLDNDGFTNWFEKSISNTDPDVPNDRYFILETCEGVDPKGTPYIGHSEMIEMKKIFNENGVLSSNIKMLPDATYSEFCRAVEDIAKKSDENDIVFISIHGHGGENIFTFSDEKDRKELEGVRYEDIGRPIDRIKSKVTVLSIDACHSGSALPALEESGRIVMTQTSKEQLSGNRDMSYYLTEAFVGGLEGINVDADGNKYVSVSEGFSKAREKIQSEWFIEMNQYKPREPQFSDPSGMAPGTYLFECKISK